jgi:hypothetical protein
LIKKISIKFKQIIKCVLPVCCVLATAVATNQTTWWLDAWCFWHAALHLWMIIHSFTHSLEICPRPAHGHDVPHAMRAWHAA